ncbi:TerB family tellurite resistance protein [Oceanisphaera sp. W20_SRM_FM3]|uniref:tellurite resistance TerB family protein n=1 Tax=Oceanisphaera sp. W20_SRM_FM3 TaxID=3240267 RepID=UPI003F96B844
MLEQLKRLLNLEAQKHSNGPSKEMAMAALLAEVMLADGDASAEEQARMAQLLQRLTQQTSAQVQQLLTESLAQQQDVVSLYAFTTELKNLPISEREQLLSALWQLAFTDDYLDPEEEGVIRQVADLLYIPHSRFIWLKEQVRQKTAI